MWIFQKMTIEERQIVVNLQNDGQSYRQIAKKLDKTPAAILKVVRAWKEDGRISAAGQIKKLLLIRKVTPPFRHPKFKPNLFQRAKNYLTSTIRWRSYEGKKHEWVVSRLPYISKANLYKKIQFNQEHVFKPPTYCNKVWLTDASMIRMWHSLGQVYVWRLVREKPNYMCSLPTQWSFVGLWMLSFVWMAR